MNWKQEAAILMKYLLDKRDEIEELIELLCDSVYYHDESSFRDLEIVIKDEY